MVEGAGLRLGGILSMRNGHIKALSYHVPMLRLIEERSVASLSLAFYVVVDLSHGSWIV